MDRSDNHTGASSSPPDTLEVSTESETFESWTLVTGGPKKRPGKTQLESESHSDEDPGEGTETREVVKREIENVDDLSDGISIISDSESPGRISPHPYLANGRPTTPASLVSDPIPKDFIETISSHNYKSLPHDHTWEVAEPIMERRAEIRTRITADDSRGREEPVQWTSILGLGRRGFVLFVGLACVFALIGRLQQPVWDHATLLSKINPLSQRVDDLELQNNILRAEIDILTKQVNYLQNKKENVMQTEKGKKQFEGKPKLERTQKVWTGDGELEPPEEGDAVPNYKRDTKGTNGDFRKDSKGDEKNRDGRQLKDEQKSDRGKRSGESHQQEKPEFKHAKHDNENQPSHENYKKKFKHEHNSKEDYDKNRKQGNDRKGHQDHSGEDSREDVREHHKHRRNGKDVPDWQENRMRHREDLRKKKNGENWFIERGSGREEARSSEKRR